MSIFERTSRVIRANLSSAHCSTTYGSQSTNDVQTSLMQMCQSVSDVLTIQWKTQQQIDKVQLNMKTYQQQAQTALD